VRLPSHLIGSDIAASLLRGVIPRYRALVTSVTGRQTDCDPLKRSARLNAELQPECSGGTGLTQCDIGLTDGGGRSCLPGGGSQRWLEGPARAAVAGIDRGEPARAAVARTGRGLPAGGRMR